MNPPKSCSPPRSKTLKPQREEELRQLVEKLGHFSNDDKQRAFEDLRFQDEYPAQYVAYTDIWHTQHDVRRLERKVLAHALTLAAMQEDLKSNLAVAQQDVKSRKIHQRYYDDPEARVPDRFEHS